MSLAVLCFATLDSLSKYLARDYPVPFLIWARYAVHLVLMACIFLPRTGLAVVRTTQPGAQFVRAACLVATSLLFVSGLPHLPIAEATSIIFLTPLFVTALSGWLLREPIDNRDWVGGVIGFIGVLTIVRPGSALLTLAVLLPLAAAISNSFYQIMTRKFRGTEGATTTNFITGLVGTALMSLTLPFYWKTPTLSHALLMVGMGAAALSGHALLIKAFKYASPAVLGPFSYAQLFWATLLGYVVFSEFPDLLTILGMLVVAASGLYVSYHHLWERPREV